MVFTKSTISFVFFAAVFVVVSAAASVIILPLLFLSFAFSGFVIIFNGLSYTSFKLASSKYNRTVLFLNRLLRKLADNIPPSVGYIELKPSKHKKISSLHVKSSVTTFLSRFLNKGEPLPSDITKTVNQENRIENIYTGFQVTHLSPKPVVIYDYEDSSVIDHYISNNPTTEESNDVIFTEELSNAPNQSEAIKLSEISNGDNKF